MRCIRGFTNGQKRTEAGRESASEENPEAAADGKHEFDISADTAKVSELGIPNVSSVAELRNNADALWNADGYQAAAEAYLIYAKNVNWLANLIQVGCEPFYSGRKDEIEEFALKVPKDDKDRETDIYNSILRYERLCHLPLYVLSDERFWCWMNFEMGYEAALKFVLWCSFSLLLPCCTIG